jgi:hypothetical protein
MCSILTAASFPNLWLINILNKIINKKLNNIIETFYICMLK